MSFLSRILFKSSNEKDLLLKGGFIMKQGSGFFNYLPLGLRVLNKIEEIIRAEFKGNASELKMSLLLAGKRWKQTNRWDNPEIYKVQDQLLLAPTHEEEITGIVGNIAPSAKELPLRVFQIGNKFRNEKRPRMGLLRAREFLMKDMYTFDKTEEEAKTTFDEINSAYENIFRNIGLQYVRVDADSGDIGGDLSNEYHVFSNHGEDVVIFCHGCGYSANQEKAVGSLNISMTGNPKSKSTELIKILNENGRQDLNILNSADYRLFKEENVLFIFPEGRELNEIKIQKVKKAIDSTHLQDLCIIIDENLAKILDSNVIESVVVADLITISENDHCKRCHGPLVARNAIEVGHTFYLGKKYSEPLDCTYKDSKGKRYPIEMGCYGIGVSRLMATIPLVSSDENGIIWPKAIAPYSVHAILINSKDNLYNQQLLNEVVGLIEKEAPGLISDNEILFDDRSLGFAAKLKDSLLIGCPTILVFGKDFTKKKVVEVRYRSNGKVEELSIFSSKFKSLLNSYKNHK